MKVWYSVHTNHGAMLSNSVGIHAVFESAKEAMIAVCGDFDDISLQDMHFTFIRCIRHVQEEPGQLATGHIAWTLMVGA